MKSILQSIKPQYCELIAASIPYFINGNVKTAIYWIAAGVLNICVTF